MNQAVTDPDWSYVVESFLPSGRSFEVFVIDQAIPLPKGNRQKELLGNAIAQHLHNLHVKTGLRYNVIYEGRPEDAYEFKRQVDEIPF